MQLRLPLGSREDMADQEVARRIAVWYQQLHNRGFSYVAQNGSDLYDESDDFTLENIAFIKEKPERRAHRHGGHWNGALMRSVRCSAILGGR